MRRRDAYKVAPMPDEKTEKPTEVPRGTCPKCLKHIGRGLNFHVKACQ